MESGALLERRDAPAGAVRRYSVLGVALDDLTFADAVALARDALADPTPRTLFFANANTLDLAAGSPDDRRILNGADYVFGDGTGVRWAARLAGIRLRANLNGSDFTPALLAAANGDSRSCFLLGAEPAVVARTAAAIARDYPGWRIAGYHHGFLDPAADERVRAAIVAVRPDLLLVGMGNPLQERWITKHRADLPVRLAVGVGALFAYMSGDYRRAPLAVRRLGLEWLFVLFLQRHKWRRYVIGAPSFLLRVLHARLIAGAPR